MGNTSATGKTALGSKSTALEVVNLYSNGLGENFLNGKVAVITGGNSGIGLETCKALSSAGCRVVIGSRSVEAGLKAIENEVQKPGNGKYTVNDVSRITVKQLNLESLSSIHSFADAVLAEPRIDYLILNAGIMAVPTPEYSENGWEKQISTNHYGHFYLTSLLRKKMADQGHPSRIIVVSSIAHTMGSVDLNDVHFKKGRKYEPWVAYGQTKMANILFAKSLSDQLKDTQVQTLSLHPGVISTGLAKHLNIFVKTILNLFINDKNIPQGASTTLYACLNPELGDKKLGGSYLKDCAVVLPNQEAQDVGGSLREKLWKFTESEIEEAIKKSEK